MREKSQPFISFCAPRQFRLPGQSLSRAAGHRAACTELAEVAPCFLLAPRLFHRDTKLHCHLSGLATVSQLHRDPKLTAVYQDSLTLAPLGQGRCKKQVTATQTAPN